MLKNGEDIYTPLDLVILELEKMKMSSFGKETLKMGFTLLN